MKLKVLLDNNTYIDQYYLGEPGVSYYIEDEGTNILLDVGYSGVFLDNAQSLGVQLSALDILVLSHGHNDHTGGLKRFFDREDRSSMTLVTHPGALEPKILDGSNIGTVLSRAEIARKCRLVQTKTPLKLSKNITYLGEIPRVMDFEEPYAIGETTRDGKAMADYILDDSALVFQRNDEIYVITGCSHSGVCNIVEYAKKVSGTEKVRGLIGGFHLFNDHSKRTEGTIAYLKKQNVEELYPCHCTSFSVRAALHAQSPVKEVGVGLELEW